MAKLQMDTRAVAIRMLQWFGQHARDLPWRRTSDPYGIWISEVMLQQTQVHAVIPYWHRWVADLPDVISLANADEARVLKLWEGLGYYRRARNLRLAAQVIVDRHDGIFPREFDEIIQLPGIGRYTAGAICSIAFNQPAPVLDGNVVRVLTRFGAERGDPGRPKVNRQLWLAALQWVEAAAATGWPRACSHFNQSLMELGATICTPRIPACGRCPVGEWCQARAQGRPERFPRSRPRAKPVPRAFVVIVAEARGRFWVRQRPVSAVNGGLWEFPNAEVLTREDTPERMAAAWWGDDTMTMEPLGAFQHTITRYRITQRVFRMKLKSVPRGKATEGNWCTLSQLEGRAFSSAHRRVLRLLQAGKGSAQLHGTRC